MSMNPTKPGGYFGRAVDETQLGRFMAYGLPVDPAPPGVITGWGLRPAYDGDGRVVFSFPVLPERGDLDHYGDGQGELIGIAWSGGGLGGLLPVVAGADIPVTLPEALWGLTLGFTVAAVGPAGSGPASAPITITVPLAGDALGFPYDISLNFG